MSIPRTISAVASSAFGSFCILSALPLLGVPFPNQASADYYVGKSNWMSELSGDRLTPQQAAYAAAVLRISVGAACIYPPTREAALFVNGAIVVRGTFLAKRDGKPMLPQWGMLGAMGLCLILGRL